MKILARLSGIILMIAASLVVFGVVTFDSDMPATDEVGIWVQSIYSQVTDAGADAEKSNDAAGDAVVEKKRDILTRGEIELFKTFRSRMQELDKREEKLAENEELLVREKEALAAKIVEVEKLREEISELLKKKVKEDQDKLQRLVKMLSLMKPKKAAAMLEKMDNKLAVDVLAGMKEKYSAAIMNTLSVDKAKLISEGYTGYLTYKMPREGIPWRNRKQADKMNLRKPASGN